MSTTTDTMATSIQADLDSARAFFAPRLTQYADDDPHVVAWGSRQSQESRFAVLTAVGQLEGATVLDVGCGVGDFYGYLLGCGIQPRRYVGVDITPEMVCAARRKYPGVSFEVRDPVAVPFPELAFDFVVESGIFNLETPRWREVTLGVLGAMYRTCRYAVGANFLSALSGNADPSSHYADPAEVLRFVADKLTHRFTLRHDYRQNDFTVFLYRGSQQP